MQDRVWANPSPKRSGRSLVSSAREIPILHSRTSEPELYLARPVGGAPDSASLTGESQHAGSFQPLIS